MTTDATTKGYGGHINNMSFRDQWPKRKGREIHMNILELETVWIAYQ